MSIQLTWKKNYSIGSWVMVGPMSVLHEQDTNGATLGWLSASARWSKRWPFYSGTHETWVLLRKEAIDGVDKELVPDFLLRYAKWDIKRNKSKCLTEKAVELLIEIKYYNITIATIESLEEYFSQISLFSNPVIDNNLELQQHANESIEKEPLFSEISFSTNTCNHNISWLPCTKYKILDDIWSYSLKLLTQNPAESDFYNSAIERYEIQPYDESIYMSPCKISEICAKFMP